MRKVRVPLADLVEGDRALGPEAAHYIGDVLRLGPGARFVAFDPASHLEAEAEVVSHLLIRVGAPAKGRVVAAAPLVIVYALAKGDKIDATVRDATELGATRIVLAETARAVVKATDRIEKKRDRWTKIAEEAARQCGRVDPPEVVGPLPWKEALAAAGDVTGYCLDPHAREPLGASLPAAIGKPLAFAIGPEGGLAAEEIATAASAGFRPVSLGPFVLRTETVAAAVLGAVRILSV